MAGTCRDVRTPSRPTPAGTSTRLHDKLSLAAEAAAFVHPLWPRDAQALGMAVKRVRPMLARRGVMVERRHSGQTRITVALMAS